MPDEPDPCDDGDGERDTRSRGQPVFTGVDDGVGQRSEGQDRHRLPTSVHPALPTSAGGEHAERADANEKDDGEVDPEHGPPPDPGEQHAAEQRADRGSNTARATPEADRSCPCFALGEKAGQERECRRYDRGGSDTLHGTKSDQHAGVRCERASNRREREDHQSGEIDPPCPVAVAGRPSGQQERGEHERVRVDHPCERSGRK